MEEHKTLLEEHENRTNEDFRETHRIIKALDDKHAMDILFLDLRDFTTVSDAFILATANSETHLQTLQDTTEEVMGELGLFCQLEGQTSNRWRLVDAGHVVIHLFSKEGRKFYGLERIWGDAPRTQFGEHSE
ncbi:ribosome silencing factor [Aminiphilus circumscriptus]|uniref:ribosome silencing factor n=1 Tax=Aminiphilus circumscriptus TaxID=290732 RepID=UPI00146FB3E9|nr:ribosome silencing factor [Aminiphilus circumscriptus]